MPKSIFSDAYAGMLQVLIAARRDRGLTQAEVANVLGKHQSFIAKIEGGERRLDVVEFCAIAEAMQIDPLELFGAVLRLVDRPFSI